jgi:hypothetical protein
MSANGPRRAKFESASHPDGHGKNLGQARYRSRAQPEKRPIVASDVSTALGGEPQVLQQELSSVPLQKSLLEMVTLLLPLRHGAEGARQIIQRQSSKLFSDAGHTQTQAAHIGRPIACSLWGQNFPATVDPTSRLLFVFPDPVPALSNLWSTSFLAYTPGLTSC